MKEQRFELRLGIVLTGITVAMILIGFVYTPYDPNGMSGSEKLLAPSFSHLMGTDNFGRDIFSRILDGSGTTLFIAVCTVLIGAFFGLLIGSLTGYFGGILDETVMRINDALTAFPSILLALVFISLLGPGKYNIIVALGVLFIPSFARIVRSEVVRCKGMEYVQNAHLMGASHLRIIFLHVLPNARTVFFSAVAIGFNNAVLAEASMSYLGIGVQPPDASLGRMMAESQTYLFSAPWYALCTGLMIVALILGFSLLGEGLRKKAGGRNA